MSDTYPTTEPQLRNQTDVMRPTAPSTLSMTDREVILDPDGVAVRGAIVDDGALLWELARDAGGLDLNSPYAYMMQCRNFHETCVIAEVFGTPAGFVTAHRVPKRPQVVFVWQVAVLPEFRGLGIGQRLLDGLVEQPACTGVRTLEATVTPSNKASEALFTSFAKARDASVEFGAGFASDDFPDDEPQERERLLIVNPIHSVE